MTFTGTANYPNETTLMNTPTGSQANRRVFLSRTLTKDVRVSGQTVIDLVASVPGTQENYGALLVDYGAGTQVIARRRGHLEHDHPHLLGRHVQRRAHRRSRPGLHHRRHLHGVGAATIDTACYLEVTKPTQNVTQWRVTRGTLDSSNRNSLFYTDATPLTANTKTQITFPTFATEHIFKAGHQIGVVIVGNLFGAGASGTAPTRPPRPSRSRIDAKQSKVILPVQGGYAALASAGGTDAETVAPVLAGVPADITVHTANPDGHRGHFTPPTATDNEDPNPTVTCDAGLGHDVQGRPDRRDLHGDRRQRQRVARRRSTSSSAATSRSAAPSRPRWR